mmetsp:Transcript_96849/g.278698  ORF Transcript_96849/g.278698 Transcript_96849/m.278698 type:complete len:256 (-) Transcript_96849:316-1083(-)
MGPAIGDQPLARLHVRPVERQLPMCECVKDHPEAPDIDLVRVGGARAPVVDLWREVGLGPGVCDGAFLRGDRLGQAEVHDFTPHLGVQQDVFELQIAVDDLFRMHVVDRPRDLLEELPRLVLRQEALPLNVGPQLASGTELHDEAHVFRVIRDIKDLDDVRVLQCPERLDLLEDSLEVPNMLEAGFEHELHGGNLAGLGMHTFHDAPETALAELFVEDVVAYDLRTGAVLRAAALKGLAARDEDDLIVLQVVHIR